MITSEERYAYLIGRKFNMLIVTGVANRRPSGELLFHCSCDCGTIKHLASKHQLVSGRLKSCGCLRRDFEDLIGKRYTKLLVVRKTTEYYRNTEVLFECLCDCGNIVKVKKAKLLQGECKSCGCLLQSIKDRYKDLVGCRFGKLVVIEHVGKDIRRANTWKCQCDCGNITTVTTGNLVRGNAVGCGCGRLELIRQYRISQGKNPDLPIKTSRELLRGQIHKLALGKQCFERDNYTCILCGKVGCYLNAHHIVPVAVDEGKALSLNNLATLCKDCHKKAHPTGWTSIDSVIQATLLGCI